MEHTINACGHANSTVHENMQSLIEQSGSVRKYAKDEIIYLQGDTAQSFCYIKKGSVKVYMNSVDGNEKTLNTARHGDIYLRYNHADCEYVSLQVLYLELVS